MSQKTGVLLGERENHAKLSIRKEFVNDNFAAGGIYRGGKKARIIIAALGTDISGNDSLYSENTEHHIVHHTSPGEQGVFELKGQLMLKKKWLMAG